MVDAVQSVRIYREAKYMLKHVNRRRNTRSKHSQMPEWKTYLGKLYQADLGQVLIAVKLLKDQLDKCCCQYFIESSKISKSESKMSAVS